MGQIDTECWQIRLIIVSIFFIWIFHFPHFDTSPHTPKIPDIGLAESRDLWGHKGKLARATNLFLRILHCVVRVLDPDIDTLSGQIILELYRKCRGGVWLQVAATLQKMGLASIFSQRMKLCVISGLPGWSWHGQIGVAHRTGALYAVPISTKTTSLKVGYIRSLGSLKKQKETKIFSCTNYSAGAGKGTGEKAPRRAAVKRERKMAS